MARRRHPADLLEALHRVQHRYGYISPEAMRVVGEQLHQPAAVAQGQLVRAGLLELADGGTLYLDEVADMPESTQARILRVLTEQAFVRVGGHRQIRVDVRVVSSTARNLEKEIAERRFREDLFYRLNVVPVTIPSLAERRDDIPTLVDHFFARFASDQGVPPPDVSEEAMAALQNALDEFSAVDVRDNFHRRQPRAAAHSWRTPRWMRWSVNRCG